MPCYWEFGSFLSVILVIAQFVRLSGDHKDGTTCPNGGFSWLLKCLYRHKDGIRHSPTQNDMCHVSVQWPIYVYNMLVLLKPVAKTF